MLDLFSAESVQQAIEASQVTTQVKAKAQTTPLGSSMTRSGVQTETSRLDYVLLAGLGLSEKNRCHLSQLKGLAHLSGLKVTEARIKDHFLTKDLGTIDTDGIVSVTGKMQTYFQETIQSNGFKSMLLVYAPSLATIIGVEQADWDALTNEEQAEVIATGHKEALVQNAPKVIKRKKAKK